MKLQVIIKPNNTKCYQGYKFILKIQTFDSMGLGWSIDEKNIGRLIGRRSDYILNRVKKKFNGHWIYLINSFGFKTYKDANETKEWLESLFLLREIIS